MRSKREKISQIVNYILLCCISFFVLVPIVWSIKSSFLKQSEIFNLGLFDFSANWTLTNLTEGLRTAPFLVFFKNSLIVTIATMFMVVVTSVMAGYGFAFFKFRGKNFLFGLVIIALVLPFPSILVPLFLGVQKIGLINNYLGMILPMGADAFGILMMRQFLVGLPKELVDAGRVDGCSHFGVFRKVVLPLAKAPIATLSAITFLAAWSNYLWPLLVAQTADKYTLPIGLTLFRGTEGTNYGYIFAGSLVISLPALIVFMVMRRSIVNNYARTGLTS